MNRIDEIKQEITEERLREGWVFEINNSKAFKEGKAENEKRFFIRYNIDEENFKTTYVEKMVHFDRYSVYNSTASFFRLKGVILETSHDEKDLELHAIKRKH